MRYNGWEITIIQHFLTSLKEKQSNPYLHKFKIFKKNCKLRIRTLFIVLTLDKKLAIQC